MSDVSRDIRISVRTTRDEGPRKSVERIDELGDHASKTTARLKLLGSTSSSTSKRLLGLAASATAAGTALKALSGKAKTFDRVMFPVHKAIVAMGGALVKSLVGGLKLATVSLGAMGVALVGVHAAFIAGKFLMKAYNVGLQALAATAAGAASGIGLVAAAIREQQAATYAYLGKGNKEFGNGLNQTRMLMRGLQMDTQLAGVGVEGLNKAFAEIAKGKGGYTPQSKTLLKGLMDFAAAGQPLEEGIQKAAKLVATLQDQKKGFGDITAAAKELGPAMEEALKQAAKEGINTREKFIEAMNSGKLSMLGGVTGQFYAVNNTLVGQLKKYFNLIRGQFADFGQQFLPEAKVGLQRIYEIFTRTMQMTTGAISGWERRGGFVDVVVNATQKVSDFYLKLIRDYLPKSEGMFRRLGDWWSKFKQGWREIVNGLKPLVDGARVVEKSFGKAWRPVWEEIKSNTKEFNESLKANQPAFEKFGTSLGNVVVKLLDVLQIFQRIITQNMPFISRVLDGIGSLFETLSRMFSSLENLPLFSNREAFMALMAMGRGMKTNKGTLVERTQTMNVQANNVNIAGGIKGAMTGAKLGKVGGPKGMAGGAVLGFLAGSGLLGGKAKGLADKAGGTLTMGGLFGGLRSTGSTGATPPPLTPPAGGAAPAAGAPKRGFLGQLFSGHKSPTGQSKNLPGNRIPLYRRMVSMNGLMGASHAYKAQREAEGRKGMLGGGMGAFGTSFLLSKASDIGGLSPDIAGGLSLGASAAMFNPKLGLGIAGGTFALRSGNMGAAALGGAGAGAMIGSAFGPMGTAIGAGLGTLVGAIMAPINRMRQATEAARKTVNEFFAASTGEMMVNIALLENAAVRSGKRESTISKTMTNQSKRYGRLSRIAGRGAAGGGPRGSDVSLMQAIGTGALMGGSAGGAIGTGIALGSGFTLAPVAIGTALAGGALGATAGGIGYGIQQFANLFSRGTDNRRRRERMGSIKEIYAAGGMSEDTFKDLTSRRTRRFARDQDVDDVKQQKYLEEFAKKSAAMETATKGIADIIGARTKMIAEMTGMSETEVVRLAQTMGVNLADNTADFNEQLEKLGVTVVKTTQQIDQSISGLVTSAMGVFDAAIKQQNAPEILDEVMKNFRMDFNQRTTKQLTAEDAKLLYGTAFEQMTAMYGGDSSKAYFEMMRQMGSAGGMAFNVRNAQGKLNPLGGLGNQMFTGMTGEAVNRFLAESEKGVTGVIGQQLAAVLAQKGVRLGAGGMTQIKEAFGNMNVDEQERFFNAIQNGDLRGLTAQDFFARSGMNVKLEELKDEKSLAFYMADNAEKELLLLESEKEIIDGMSKFFGPAAENPEWWSKEALTEVFIAAGLKGDTMTPRGGRIGDTTSSRLSQTLARHEAMNSMISGTRTVTSAFRTSGLGSINSDHLTGRAYDLVGNQLGMYKTTVERNGGFAEFHGGTLNRHLHVVPGPGISAPMGDMTVPASKSMAPQVQSAPSGRNNNVTINLNVNGLGIKEAIPQIKNELERAMYEMNNRS